MPVPSVEVEAAFLAPITEHVRRVDIYEADGETVWLRNARVEKGGVTVDYSRDERRSIDLTFDNSDGALTYDPNGFWYDKIIKCYRGVEYDAVVTDEEVVAVNLIASAPTSLGDAVLASGATFLGREDWYSLAINTTGHGARTMVNEALLTDGETYTASWLVGNPNAHDVSVTIDWSDTGSKTVAIPAGQAMRVYTTSSRSDYTSVYRFTDLALSGPPAPQTIYIADVMVTHGATEWPYFDGDLDAARWTGTPNASTSELIKRTERIERRTWETQIGEFMIDKIAEPHFPNQIAVNGRDYAKKMMLSKFVVATGFNAGASLDATINTIASNAGINAQKRLIPLTGKVLGRDFIFERGVSRWEACKELADAYGYELFFDAEGFLVMREYQDPSSSPIVYTFRADEYSNLVDYNKTVNDSRLYNHVVVSGEASDIIPVWAEARNDNPSSPTNIALIGDRLYQYVSSFITTTTQAQDVATKFLAIHSLQEYQLDFSSLMLPWMEVGEIFEFLDPKRTVTQPDRFLLSTLNIPLDLGPMGGTGKRVTVLG